MENNPQLPIEIVEIEPVAVYEGVVYDQTVISKIRGGMEIKLFDKYPHSIEKDMIGDDMNVFVSILPKSGIKIDPDDTVGIYPPANPSSEWSYDFIGNVLDIDVDSKSMTFDIGVGSILVGLDNEIINKIEENNITPNDQLYIPTSRSDLVEIN